MSNCYNGYMVNNTNNNIIIFIVNIDTIIIIVNIDIIIIVINIEIIIIVNIIVLDGRIDHERHSSHYPASGNKIKSI